MLDTANIPSRGLSAVTSPPVPIADLVLGQPAEEVAEMLPRVFNLCPVVQRVAVRMALGLEPGAEQDLAQEVAREHALALSVFLPTQMGLTPVPAASGSAPHAAYLLGGRPMPADLDELQAFARSDAPVAPVIREVTRRFAPQVACSATLPEPNDNSVFTIQPMENSVAARHLEHPLMRHIEKAIGRGPLWRVVARLIDLIAAEKGDLPNPRNFGRGAAIVPAARGLYAIRTKTEAGRLTGLTRVTPTDHLLASGGIMDQSLASLPIARHDQAGLLLRVLDPCSPVKLREVANA